MKERPIAAFTLTALETRIHTMYGAFLLETLTSWSAAAGPRLGGKRTLLSRAMGLVITNPVLVRRLASWEGFDEERGEPRRLRSAHHVFPSEWRRAGDLQVPRLAVLIRMAAIAWSLYRPADRCECQTLILVPMA